MEKTKDALNEEQNNARQDIYDKILDALGSETLALFCTCAIFDMPYVIDAVPRYSDEQQWISYMDGLKDIKGIKRTGFDNGLTDLKEIVSKAEGITVTQLVAAERKAHPDSEIPAGQSQLRNWGTGGAENPYSKADYDRLDYYYGTLSARLMSAGGVDPQQELILRKVSELYLLDEKLRAAGDIAGAQKAVKMALDLLSSEQLQKKDAKPVENVRIDSIVDALEKWGAVQNGQILGFEELQELLLKKLGRLGGKPAHQFTETLDAADYELWYIRNCVARNEDLPQWADLPDALRFGDEVANEFAPTPSDAEDRAYKEIGIVRNRPEKIEAKPKKKTTTKKSTKAKSKRA